MQRKLVAPGAGAGSAFETAEEVLHTVALPVELLVEPALLFAVRFARAAVPGPKFFELLAQLVIVEAFVPPPPSNRAGHRAVR